MRKEILTESCWVAAVMLEAISNAKVISIRMMYCGRKSRISSWRNSSAFFSRLSWKSCLMQRWPGYRIPSYSAECSCSPSQCLPQFAICFLEGEWLELYSNSQTRFHQNLMALRLPCLHGKYFVLFFVVSHRQPMFVSCVLLSLPLTSSKLFSRKLLAPSRRDCTLGKGKVQLRASFRLPWFFIIRFPEHSYIVSKDPSWKQITRVTSPSLFHSFVSLSSIIPLTVSIFSLEVSCICSSSHILQCSSLI